MSDFFEMDNQGEFSPEHDRIEQLDADLKNKLEHAFGEDFSSVKIHTGPYADQIARDQNAEALTLGSDIYFRAGKYLPQTEEGIALLAHELQHVIQFQQGARMTYLEDLSELEVEASRIEEQLQKKSLHNFSQSELNQNTSVENAVGNSGGSGEALRKGVGEKGGDSIDDFRKNSSAPKYRVHLASGKSVVLSVDERRRLIDKTYEKIKEDIQSQISLVTGQQRDELLIKYMSIFAKG